MAQNTTFDGTLMRERDNNVSKTHERELAAKESLINMWKRRCEGINKTMFDEKHVTERLLRLLGFESVGEALIYIETANESQHTKYRDCLERNTEMAAELSKAKEHDYGTLESQNQELKQCVSLILPLHYFTSLIQGAGKVFGAPGSGGSRETCIGIQVR